MLTIITFGFIIITANANVLELCDKEFSKLYQLEQYSTIDSKIAHWESMSETCSGSGVYESRLGFLYSEAKNYDKAKVVLKKGLELESDYKKELLFNLANAEGLSGNLDNAHAISNKLVNQYSDWFGSYSMLGQVLAEQHNFSEAIQAYEKANELEEKADTYSVLAICYHYEEQHEKAILAMQKAIALDPKELKQRLAIPATAYSLIELGYIAEAEDLLIQHQKVRPESKDDPVFAKAVLYLQKILDESKE